MTLSGLLDIIKKAKSRREYNIHGNASERVNNSSVMLSEAKHPGICLKTKCGDPSLPLRMTGGAICSPSGALRRSLAFEFLLIIKEKK
jgi:hypothetical protein